MNEQASWYIDVEDTKKILENSLQLPSDQNMIIIGTGEQFAKTSPLAIIIIIIIIQ